MTRAENSFFLPPKEFVAQRAALEESFAVEPARQYTRWLATHHYENFHVVSFLLPRHLHQDFYNVYAFCRWADDLGDEIGDTAESLRLLEWWSERLDAMYSGEASHPVYVALRDTVERLRIPKEPFADLIKAFVQDQTITRYATWNDLYGYCRYSANPVGRLVLHLCGYADEHRLALSDATCTALQLANFWQDITVDLLKDRIYLPLEVLAKHQSGYDDIFRKQPTPGFRAALREACDVTDQLFRKGLPLSRTVDRRLSLDLELFSRGGMRVIEKIRALNYDVLAARPYITKGERVRLLLRCVFSAAFRAA